MLNLRRIWSRGAWSSAPNSFLSCGEEQVYVGGVAGAKTAPTIVLSRVLMCSVSADA